MEAFFDDGKSGLIEARFSLDAEIQWYRTRGPTGPLLHSGLDTAHHPQAGPLPNR